MIISIIILVGILLLILIKVLIQKYNNKLRLQKEEIDALKHLSKSFVDASHNIVFLKDDNFRYIFVNKAFEKFNNLESSQVVGYTDYDFVDKELADIYRKSDLEIFKNNAIIENDVKLEGRVHRTIKFPVELSRDRFGIGAYVEDVTREYNYKRKLEEINGILEEERTKLELILDSTAEGIYGIDINGNCTFINNSGLRILGYNSHDELVGKNIHLKIHHSYKDGRTMPQEKCQILNTIVTGKSICVDNEVLWRSDGRCFDVEYFASPQYRGGKITGVVVTFSDITERKKAEEEITYFSYHNELTGLYNRRFFEEEVKRLNVERNLPVSMIIGDVNGLKLTNDIFGHATGDLLLQKTAQAIKSACRADDIVAHWGGDEFAVFLPKTSKDETAKIVKRIKRLVSEENIKGLNISISLGYHTKYIVEEDMQEILKSAEKKMYVEKTIHRKNINRDMINTIVSTLHQNYPGEKEHSLNVSQLCKDIGRAMDLPEEQIIILEDAGFYHDIGKIVLDNNFVNKDSEFNVEDWREVQQHPVVGYRILNSYVYTSELARYVLHHHERWDGKGYPKKLKGKDIPKISRIIAVADRYDRLINQVDPANKMTKEEAIRVILDNTGSQFDPDIVKVFIEMLKNRDVL